MQRGCITSAPHNSLLCTRELNVTFTEGESEVQGDLTWPWSYSIWIWVPLKIKASFITFFFFFFFNHKQPAWSILISQSSRTGWLCPGSQLVSCKRRNGCPQQLLPLWSFPSWVSYPKHRISTVPRKESSVGIIHIIHPSSITSIIQPWASHFTSPSFRFPICKMGMMMLKPRG